MCPFYPLPTPPSPCLQQPPAFASYVLPRVINLGNYNFTAGEWVEQKDFKAMTFEEVQQLALRLQAQPHVTHLNLGGHGFGPEGARVLIAPISAQTGLQTLNLNST